MATIRTTIPDFQLANPLYTAAQVSFFTVNASGQATATLATLFADPTSAIAATNPQTLDGTGKFSAPIYCEVPVIAQVVGPNVGSHTTGVINMRGTWRGNWVTARVYFANDFIADPSNGRLYVAATDYTSGASVAADVAASNLVLAFDPTVAPGSFSTLALGSVGATSGILSFKGKTSGVVTVQVQDVAGTYNFELPTSAGSAGQPMLSGGGGAAPMTFGTLSVAGGGTGQTVLNNHGVLIGASTSGITQLAAGSSGALLIGQGASADPAFNAMSGDATITSGGALTIAANAVTNAKQATMAAWTFKGNATGGVAVPTDVTIDGLTLKASPASTDEVWIWSIADSAWRKTTVAGIGTSSGVSSLAGNTGAFTLGAGLTNSTNVLLADASYHQGYLSGCVLSPDANPQIIDIQGGVCCSDDGTTLMKTSGINKGITGSWIVGTGNIGLDSGSAASASSWYHVYIIERTDTGVVDALVSLAPPSLAQVLSSISNASPAVATAPSAHGLQAGQPVKFTTTGALPTGLSTATQYFVIAAGLTATAFEVSATVGGAAINTSGAGSGVHTVVTAPILPANYTKQRRIGSFKTDGSSHILAFTQAYDTIIFGAQVAEFSTTNPGTSAINVTLAGAPPGVVTEAFTNWDNRNVSTNHYVLVSPLAIADVVPSSTAFTFEAAISAGNLSATGPNRTLTSTAAQIRYRLSASGASDLVFVNTVGYRDFRGQ